MAPQQKSYLSNLPGEIKNQIFDLVLAEPNKIIPTKANVPNEFRLINRQLHEESRFLEFKLADKLTIHCDLNDKEQPGVMQQLITFAKHIPAPAFDHIRTIYLTYTLEAWYTFPYIADDPYQNIDLSSVSFQTLYAGRDIPESTTLRLTLDEFCLEHPQVQVRHTLTEFFIGAVHADESIAALIFLFQGIYYTYSLRGQLPPMWMRELESFKTHLYYMLRNVRKRQEFQAPNIKFYPVFTTFDGARFKQELLQTPTRSWVGREIINDITSRGLLDQCVEMARKWVEEGI
ncbi:hypothetical protein BDU57DRAFT_573585 [Ampelomyces quisqualis]|uniref:Uncharacterized protein n=1 Tax=Ampelomyces quisqualis TaxID=50730 RepID=A0A6A5QMK9_AMPQU|nr:hypothetical protein BDU57DRAFT_573585 [Ampelomyces quisqualis]